MSLQPSRLYEFGPFRLDPAERLLLRNGQPVTLTPKAFGLLLLLVPRVVTGGLFRTRIKANAGLSQYDVAKDGRSFAIEPEGGGRR